MKVSPLAAGKRPTAIESEIPDTLRLLADAERKPDGHGLFRIIHQDFGDKRLVWDCHRIEEVREAKKIFNDLIAQCFVPYYIDQKTGQPTKMPMAEFDAVTEEVFLQEREIVMAPMQAAAAG